MGVKNEGRILSSFTWQNIYTSNCRVKNVLSHILLIILTLFSQVFFFHSSSISGVLIKPAIAPIIAPKSKITRIVGSKTIKARIV